MTRPIPLRSGAKTPQARVLQRRHNTIIQSLALEIPMRHVAANRFADGRLFELVNMVAQQSAYLEILSARAASARRDMAEPLHPADLDSMIRAIRNLEAAAGLLREAAALGKPVLMQAAE